MIKSIIDFYNYFVKSKPLVYPLSTQIDQNRTVFEIFVSVLIIELVIWFVLSSFYIFSVSFFGLNFWYPLEYLLFTIGIIISVILGATVSIHFFSAKKIRLIPTIILLAFFYYSENLLFIIFVSPLIVFHFIWAIKHSISSFLYVYRRERVRGMFETRIMGKISAISNKEITILYRDKLIFSFILTAVLTGIGTGYLFLNGNDLLIPETLRENVADVVPSAFILMGIYVIVVYTAVFPSLALFLNEEKTLWILRNLPIENDTLVFGKTWTLVYCFVTTIPFISYVALFIGLDNIAYLTWFLVFSYIAAVIIAVPLGAKYVGKKSDVLLLYSVAMILLVVIGFGSIFGKFVGNNFEFPLIIYLDIIIIEMIILYFSLKLSSKIYGLKYKVF
jgi:hypothetical protein